LTKSIPEEEEGIRENNLGSLRSSLFERDSSQAIREKRNKTNNNLIVSELG